jgi:hypothetical protein
VSAYRVVKPRAVVGSKMVRGSPVAVVIVTGRFVR